MSNAADLTNRILLAASDHGITLFRNNTGLGWVGSHSTRRQDGSVLILNARPLHAGLCKGSSDLVGLRQRVITDADVGSVIAQFVAVEVKTRTDRLSEHQRAFLDFVNSRGGVAIVARSIQDVEML